MSGSARSAALALLTSAKRKAADGSPITSVDDALSPAAALAAATTGSSCGTVSTRDAPASLSWCASSAGEYSGLLVVTTAPSDASALKAICFGSVIGCALIRLR